MPARRRFAQKFASAAHERFAARDDLYKLPQAYRADRLELMRSHVERGTLSPADLQAVEAAFKRSDDSVQRHPMTGGVEFRHTMGEVANILHLKEGHKPATDYYAIDDNSGSMGLPGRRAFWCSRRTGPSKPMG